MAGSGGEGGRALTIHHVRRDSLDVLPAADPRGIHSYSGLMHSDSHELAPTIVQSGDMVQNQYKDLKKKNQQQE